MSLILDKNAIPTQFHQLIRISCTFFTDPKYPFKENSYTIKDTYSEIIRRTEPYINSEIISFVKNVLFKPLDILIETYLGKNKYGQSKEIQFYRVVDDKYLILPIHFAKLLLNIKSIPERQYQINRANFKGSLLERQQTIINQAEYNLVNYNTLTLNLYPGFGKTVLATYLSCRFKLLTCVIINMTPQIEQWKKTYQQQTDANIWIVGDNDATVDPDYIDVIICMAERFNKIPDNLRFKVGHLIIDEAHLLCTPGNVLLWLSFYPKYLTLLTATLVRPDDSMEKMIYSAAGEKSIISVKNPKKFKVYVRYTGCSPELESRVSFIGGENKSILDYNKYKKALINDEKRNILIVDLIEKSREFDKKILTLTSEKEHIRILSDLLKDRKLEFSSFFGNMKSYLDAPILLGTFPKIGTGFDEATFCDTFNGKRLERLIMCFTIKKFNTFEQTIGRVMRSDCPDIFILVDNDSAFISRRHLSVMIWFIREYTNGEVIM